MDEVQPVGALLDHRTVDLAVLERVHGPPRVAVVVEADLAWPTENAGLHHLQHRAREGPVADLEAEHVMAVVGSRGLSDPECRPDGVGHRFRGGDVLPSLESLDRERFVQRIRQDQHHRVDVIAGEQVLVLRHIFDSLDVGVLASLPHELQMRGEAGDVDVRVLEPAGARDPLVRLRVRVTHRLEPVARMVECDVDILQALSQAHHCHVDDAFGHGAPRFTSADVARKWSC
jgi:hypothetical protein